MRLVSQKNEYECCRSERQKTDRHKYTRQTATKKIPMLQKMWYLISVYTMQLLVIRYLSGLKPTFCLNFWGNSCAWGEKDDFMQSEIKPINRFNIRKLKQLEKLKSKK